MMSSTSESATAVVRPQEKDAPTDPRPQILGVIELDEGLPPGRTTFNSRPGCLMNPATLGRQIITEMADGALPERIIRGDSSLEAACVAAAERLVKRGATAITADCGFFARHQDAVAAAVDVPVILSSLLLIPTLLRQLPQRSKLAVITADASCLGDELLYMDDPRHAGRVVKGGIENGTYVRNVLARPPVRTEVCVIEAEVLKCVTALCDEHSDVGAVLLECTGFPVVSAGVRSALGVPVYDLISLCRLVLDASVVSRDSVERFS